MIFDSHMHTEFSSDSTMKIEDAIKIANDKNIGIILTEHIDLDFPIPDLFRCHVPTYLNAYKKYRSHNTLLGIEVGLTIRSFEKNEKIMDHESLDYVIGSIHEVDGEDIYSIYTESAITEIYYKRYLEIMLECVQTYNNFDSLGHIDYICRYSSLENPNIDINLYNDILHEIMKTLISKGKVMELNTRRLHDPLARQNLMDIYKIYKNFGGKYLTLGSDSHSTDAIGINFNIALEMISELGLEGVYFKERKMHLF